MEEQAATLTQQVAEEIMRTIRQRNGRPGDKLPTEKELCAELGAGRNTVREALKILASKNIITIRQGAGSFISDKQGVADDPLGFAMVADRVQLTADLLQVREIMEPAIAGLAAQHATPEDIAELERILLEMEAMIQKRKDYSDQDVRFHTKIAECTHNVVMKNLLPVIGNGVKVFAREVSKTEYKQTLLSHRKIFCAIRDHRPFEAQREMQFHLLYNDNRYKRTETK